MQPRSLQETCIEELRKVLATLAAMPPLPAIGSAEYYQNVDDYRKQYEVICELVRKSEVIALMTIPDEIGAALESIKKRQDVLLFNKPEKEDKDGATN